MRRRDVLAGLGGAGVVASAGAVAVFGVPAGNNADGSDGSSGVVGKQHEPYEIETVDAQGSDAGTTTVPASDRPTFVDFFATWCDPCIKQMDALAVAHERVGDEVRFLSVTNEPVGESITRAELAQWWKDNGGNWTIGLDPTSELTTRYWGTPYPTAVAIDASGTVRWRSSGVKTADKLVAGIERALEGGAD